MSLVTRSSKIIAAGFLVRAFVGQALFWISYLRLPFARSLQIGDGFWFFAEDGPYYLFCARQAAEQGFPGILHLGAFLPSRFFLQVLALLVLAFGSVASLAILINCAAYALTCAVLVRMERNDVALAAIAFGPAAMLFSFQLLKDTLFFLLMVLMIALFRRWQELWRSDSSHVVRGLVACTAGMLGVTYALAGIRWYFAAICWGASAIFFLLAGWPARRRGWALACSAVLFVLLAQSVRLGALDTPPQFVRLLNPFTALQWKPATATELVAEKRYGFETTPAATTIAVGPLFADAVETPRHTTAIAARPATETALGPGPTSSAKPRSAPAQPPPAWPLPRTVAARVITGFSAAFLPRFLAQAVGLIRIGGGRGLWFFAEVDTIAFDLVLLYAVVSCTRALRRGTARATPLFVFLVVVFVMTAGPMVYTINNFGTLFRLRQMLYVIAAVIPLTLRKPTREHE
jgi:hypothetical protein